MNVELKTPSPAAIREYNENAERPYLIADSCLLDGGAVELEIGGVTVAGIFHDYDAYELALGVLDMEAPERPEERDHRDSGLHFEFWTPEELASGMLEEELEYEAWAMLTALHTLRSRQEAVTAPYEVVEGGWSSEAIRAAELPTQRFARGGYVRKFTNEEIAWHTGDNAITLPHEDKQIATARFLDPVGLLTAEEVDHMFDVKGQVA